MILLEPLHLKKVVVVASFFAVSGGNQLGSVPTLSGPDVFYLQICDFFLSRQTRDAYQHSFSQLVPIVSISSRMTTFSGTVFVRTPRTISHAIPGCSSSNLIASWRVY